MKILPKLLIVLLVLTVLPLAILGSIALHDIATMGSSATAKVTAVGETTVADSTTALKTLGESQIKTIAEAVAKQLEIYIKEHPEMTVEELQQDEYFKELAVQPVGQTGYTAITDVATLTARFHASEGVVNLDLHNLAEKLPGFWGVMSKSEGGVPVSGYYEWAEADGSLNEKYMHIAIVDAVTADGVTFSVAATTYIDEFSAPAKATEAKVDAAVGEITADLSASVEAVKQKSFFVVILMVVIVVLVGVLFAQTITKPIKDLTLAGNKIAEGNLEVELPEVQSDDEIKELSKTMTLLVGAIRYLKTQKGEKKSKKK
jgi:HAMP domain-containing protein